MNVENKKKVLRHLGMIVLAAIAVAGAVSFQSCTQAKCTEVSYLPGRCG